MLFLFLTIFSCKTQNGTYKDASKPPSKSIVSNQKIPIAPSGVSKGAIQLNGEVVTIEEQTIHVKVIDVIAVGEQVTSTIPVRNQTLQLNNGPNYPLVENSQYRMEVRINAQDSKRGSLLKLLVN